MARLTRIVFDGACYHVINRGNYRGRIFEDDGAKEAFETCLGEAAVRMGWIVHGWVIMGNHYHLALQTPQGNLSEGMQWLQVTFSARFNAYRKEHGQVFQGRYKAILVEKGEALGRVCHYIDLNPVRAGMVEIAQLATYRFGSYLRLRRPNERPMWFDPRSSLTAAGGSSDTKKGHTAYAGYLGWIMGEIEAGRGKEFLLLSKGMAIGSEDFVQGIHARLKESAAIDRTLDALGKRQRRERSWDAHLRKLTKEVGRKERADTRVSALWKAVLALRMKTETDVANAWLAEKLGMGSPTYVSKQVGLARAGQLRLKGMT